MTRIPGLVLTDHTFTVPLDHAAPGRARSTVFAREVVATDRAGDDLPWLIFLEGGPGSKSPRPSGPGERWLGQALKTHRVLLLDQRGTGRSTPISARTVAGMTDRALADYLRLFRADSIVRDAELIRQSLLGYAQWESLGQSYGGFVTMTYLSLAPSGLRSCYVTGGLPGLSATADDVYARTYPRVAAKNAAYYARYPEDVAAVNRIADHLAASEVLLPDGDRLTVTASVSWATPSAWATATSGCTGCWTARGTVRRAVGPVPVRGHDQDGLRRLAAVRVAGVLLRPVGPPHPLGRRPRDRGPAQSSPRTPRPLLFTGEMMYPWMFRDIAALRPFAGAADLLA